MSSDITQFNPTPVAEAAGFTPVRFMFFDTETAGLSGGVCDLGIVETDVNFKILRSWGGLIDPEMKISPGAMGIHHITDEMVRYEPTMAEFFGQFGPILSRPGTVYIGHNIAFDIKAIAGHSQDYLTLDHQRICTLRLARKQWPDNPDHKLQTLRYQFGLDAGTAHRAMGDALATVNLARLIASLNDTDLVGLLALARKPMDGNYKLTFGKHKGTKLKDAPADYRLWLRRQPDVDPDLREALASLKSMGA